MTWVKEGTYFPTKKKYAYDNIEFISITPDERYLAGGGGDKTFVWDTTTGEIIASASFPSSIRDIKISPTGKFALVDALRIYIWDVTDPGNEPEEFLADLKINAFDVCKNERFVALNSTRYPEYCLYIWDLENNKAMREIRNKKMGFRRVSLSPDMRFVAATDVRDEWIFVWEIDAKRKPIRLMDYPTPLNRIHFLDDGKTLVSFTRDKEVIFWDLEKKSKIKTFQASHGLTIDGPGQIIATSGEFFVQVRDPEWNVLKEIKSNGFAWDILLSPSGRSLYIASGGAGITKWMQKVPMEKAVQDTLQSKKWIEPAVLYFKQLGFFTEFSQLPDDEFVSEVMKTIHKSFHAKQEAPPTQFDLVRLLAEDTDRVYWGDSEIVSYETAYTETLLGWSSISKGAFTPSDIHEDWSDDFTSIELSFDLAGKKHTIRPEVSGDWLDLSIVAQINEIISSEGYGLFIFDEPHDQSYIMVCLTDAEKNKLEVDLGMSFQHL